MSAVTQTNELFLNGHAEKWQMLVTQLRVGGTNLLFKIKQYHNVFVNTQFSSKLTSQKYIVLGIYMFSYCRNCKCKELYKKGVLLFCYGFCSILDSLVRFSETRDTQ